MSIFAGYCVQVQVAEEFGTKLRAYQDVMHPAAYGDSSREWAHLVLTKVCPSANVRNFGLDLQARSAHAAALPRFGNYQWMSRFLPLRVTYL